ncbi:MAG TPA: aminotransferase class I/II-fold pyridoxal phosphate-dependent enzyme [Anaeromyxobacteraceae bacterium]|nr:aminotransferase class I/II-fold pyridoxal phosphate-dependent enzyme [Anaeromyxobacteraceae bacterium]
MRGPSQGVLRRMADIFERCAAWKEVQLVKLAGHYPYYRVIEHNDGTEVVIGGKRLIMACSNNYLGLAQDPRVREAAAEAARQWGSSTCGSRVLNGTLVLHDELDRRLATFLRKEAAVCFSTGFTTNLGTISSLVQRRDLVFADRMVHASIVEGIHACYGEAKRFRHNNMEDLERLLAAAPDEAGKLIVVDGVYSMEGDLADLVKIVELKKKYGARLMSDEAHGLGVMGQNGRGTGEHLGVHDEVDLVMATFSKSLASIGGVIAGRADVINWIKHKARSLLFQASMTPPAVAAALRALEIIQAEPERRERLWDISERVHRELRLLGFDTDPSVTPVIPIVVGDQALNFIFWRKLTDAGLFVSPVTKPAVERDLVRAVFMATHSDEQVDRALEMFKRCGREVGIIPYEKPHTRVEVKVARPGSTGFVSSKREGAVASPQMQGSLEIGAVLLNRAEPLGQRLSDAAEILTWRALNLGPEDVRKLSKLPEKIWTQRHRVQNRLLSLGMEWMSRRQSNRHADDPTHSDLGHH